MNDLISRQDAIKCCRNEWEEEVEERLRLLPSAEPEIIRCKECKWFGDIGCAIKIVDDSDKPTENDFCSFAERKDMDDLINRQDAIDAIVNRETTTTRGMEYLDGYAKCQHDILDIIEQLPSAERKGEWRNKPNTYGVAYCSECDFELPINDTNYCPNCGADMRERRENEHTD